MNHNEITSMAREAGLFVPRAGLPENGALIRFFHAAYAAGMGMTTLREAAQQALEALTPFVRGSWTPGLAVQAAAAMDRLEAALAEPVQEPWEHLKQYGYAPGSYMSRCHACDKIASGVDKRAITCRPCAEARHAALAEPAFHGFMSADGTRVDLCFTPGAPRADGVYATAYYTAPPQPQPVGPVAWSHINGTSDTKWHPHRPGGPVEDTTDKAAGIRWQLCLLAQTEEFSETVRNQIARGVWLIDRLSAKLQEIDSASKKLPVPHEWHTELATTCFARSYGGEGSYYCPHCDINAGSVWLDSTWRPTKWQAVCHKCRELFEEQQ